MDGLLREISEFHIIYIYIPYKMVKSATVFEQLNR